MKGHDLMNFNMKLDDDIVTALDAERRGLIPRRSRTAHIEAILYEKYKEQVEQLRAERQQSEIHSANEALEARHALSV